MTEALRVTFKAADEDLSGATCKVGDSGETFDIAAALEVGDGKIVLDLNDPYEAQVANALRFHPGVTPVDSEPIAEPSPPVTDGVDDCLDKLTRPELDQRAAELKLEGAEDLSNKAEVIAYIRTGQKPAEEA